MATGNDTTFPSSEAGVTMQAYYAKPDSDGAQRAPGVIIIHEIFGLNDDIRDIARRFADQGYAALAVDLFSHGNRNLCLLRTVGSMIVNVRAGRPMRDLNAALRFLQGQPEVDSARVGTIGFCMGGGYALAFATVNHDLKASAVFYGMNPRPLQAVKEACAVVGSYPEKDFTKSAATKLEAALTEYGVPHDIKIYPDARHSFFNSTGKSYKPDAADDAWQRTLAFFKEHIG